MGREIESGWGRDRIRMGGGIKLGWMKGYNQDGGREIIRLDVGIESGWMER